MRSTRPWLVALWLAPLWLATACARNEPSLMDIQHVGPERLTVGELLRVDGEGFAVGRPCQVHLDGELRQAGQRPRPLALRLSARALAPGRVEARLSRVEALGSHGTFVGRVRVVFPAAQGGQVQGERADVRLELLRPLDALDAAGAAAAAAAWRDVLRREEAARDALRALGLAVADRRAGAEGLQVEGMAGATPVGPLAPGDVLLRANGVTLLTLADLAPAPRAHGVALEVKRQAPGDPLRLRMPWPSEAAAEAQKLRLAAWLGAVALLYGLFLGPSRRLRIWAERCLWRYGEPRRWRRWGRLYLAHTRRYLLGASGTEHLAPGWGRLATGWGSRGWTCALLVGCIVVASLHAAGPLSLARWTVTHLAWCALATWGVLRMIAWRGRTLHAIWGGMRGWLHGALACGVGLAGVAVLSGGARITDLTRAQQANVADWWLWASPVSMACAAVYFAGLARFRQSASPAPTEAAVSQTVRALLYVLGGVGFFGGMPDEAAWSVGALVTPAVVMGKAGLCWGMVRGLDWQRWFRMSMWTCWVLPAVLAWVWLDVPRSVGYWLTQTPLWAGVGMAGLIGVRLLKNLWRRGTAGVVDAPVSPHAHG